jgi:hypothetical protein
VNCTAWCRVLRLAARAHMLGCRRRSTMGTSSSSRTTSFIASSSPRISAALRSEVSGQPETSPHQCKRIVFCKLRPAADLKARSLTVSMYSMSILYVVSQRFEGGRRSTHMGHFMGELRRV